MDEVPTMAVEPAEPSRTMPEPVAKFTPRPDPTRPRRTGQGMQPPSYTPTPAEVAKACAEFQAGWSPAEFDSRLVAGVNAQVELLASILRPMAEDAGYAAKRRTGETADEPEPTEVTRTVPRPVGTDAVGSLRIDD